MESIKEQKEYREERFEFALYVNNNLICKRNFKINNYIDGSMQTLDFKMKVDEIVNMIDDDLKSKSRVYTWFYDDTDEQVLEPWECTFKFVVTDNKKEVISKIWDGYAYPKAVRDRVDIANKTVKLVDERGQVRVFDKNSFFEKNKDRLSMEQYILRAQILDKPDLLIEITKNICETCSPRENGYQKLNDYITVDTYKDKIYEVTNDGTLKRGKHGNLSFKNGENSKEYNSIIEEHNKKLFSKWAKDFEKKTKKYYSNLFS